MEGLRLQLKDKVEDYVTSLDEQTAKITMLLLK